MRVLGTVYNVEWQRGCIRLTDERVEALINSLRVASLTGDEALTAFRGVVSNENRRTAMKFFGALTQEAKPLEGDVELEVTRQEVEDIELALFTYAQHESRLLELQKINISDECRARIGVLFSDIENRIPARGVKLG